MSSARSRREPARPASSDPLAPYADPAAPGACAAVFHDGRPLLVHASGAACLEPLRAATPRTNFRLASLSKQVTATAVLRLVMGGALRLEQPAADLLPELGAAAAGVRVYHLLSHTSGVADYEPLLTPGETRQVRDHDVLELLRGSRPAFAPGARFGYSNSGYALLAVIAERASGARYADLLRATVFEPLGMHATIAREHGGPQVPERAYGYSAAGDGFAPTDQSATSAVLGDGGVYSSIADLERWEAALVRRDLLAPALLERAWAPAHLAGGGTVPYGFGWYVDEDRGRLRLTHHGETIGFTNAVVRYPAERIGVWVLTNRTGGRPWAVAQRLADHALANVTGRDPHGAPARWPFEVVGG